jgi:hypothetical protein
VSVIFGSGAVHVPRKQLLVGRGDFAKLFLCHLVLVDVGVSFLSGVCLGATVAAFSKVSTLVHLLTHILKSQCPGTFPL